MKRLAFILFLLTSAAYSVYVNGNFNPFLSNPKKYNSEIYKFDPYDYPEGTGYYRWLCASKYYHEPIFQQIKDKSIESYRFITNVGEDGWSRFVRITKDASTYTMVFGMVYPYQKNRKREINEIKLNKEEWDEALSAINDINQTILHPPYDNEVVYDGGFTIFESIKDGEVRFTMRNGIFMATKERNLESFRSAEIALRNLYIKAKRENRIYKTIDLENVRRNLDILDNECKDFLKTL